MADFQREKLIDLKTRFVEGFDCGDCPPANDKCRKCLTEKEADYLLKNGVIVPPCKPGDTVYMPWEWNGTKGVAILTVTHIITNDSHSYIKAPLYSDDEDYSCKYGYGRFEFDDFGKTVFLTPEEAEKALAEKQSI